MLIDLAVRLHMLGSGMARWERVSPRLKNASRHFANRLTNVSDVRFNGDCFGGR